MIKRIIFDLDNTLLRTFYKKEKKYFDKIFNGYKEKIDEIMYYLNKFEFIYKKEDITKLSNYLTKSMNYNIDEKVIKGWIEVTKYTDNYIEEGAIFLLKTLKKRNISLVVLTNWFKESQINRLKETGLYEFFDNVYAGDDGLKPHKETFIMACDKYRPDECLMIGDNFEKDYEGSSNIGIKAVLYDPFNKCHKDILKITKLEELLEIVEEENGK